MANDKDKFSETLLEWQSKANEAQSKVKSTESEISELTDSLRDSTTKRESLLKEHDDWEARCNNSETSLAETKVKVLNPKKDYSELKSVEGNIC